MSVFVVGIEFNLREIRELKEEARTATRSGKGYSEE